MNANNLLNSNIPPSQFNESAYFKEYEAICAERVLKYLNKPDLFEGEFENQDVEYKQNNLDYSIQKSNQQDQDFDQDIEYAIKNEITRSNLQSMSDYAHIRINSEGCEFNEKSTKRLQKVPTFSKRDDDFFQEDGDKKQTYFHTSLQVSEDSCYHILQDSEESQKDDDYDKFSKLELNKDNHIILNRGGGNIPEEIKNYELSSIQQNTQNSLANFNPPDDILLTSNRETGYQNDLNNLMQLNFNLIFPNSRIEEDSQKLSEKHRSSHRYSNIPHNNAPFLNISKNTINDSMNKQPCEESMKKDTLTAKELYLKAKEQNRIFLENLQKQSLRVNIDELISTDNHFKDSIQLNNQLKDKYNFQDYKEQNQIEPPNQILSDQNQPEKACINTYITENGENGDMIFDLNDLDQSLDNENFYDMIQQNINKVKEQTNFPHFNATFYPLDTIVLDKEEDKEELIKEQQEQNSSSITAENITSCQSKNATQQSEQNNSIEIEQTLPINQLPQPQQSLKYKPQKENTIKQFSKVKQQNNIQQQTPQNNALSLINKYYSKRNRSQSQLNNQNPQPIIQPQQQNLQIQQQTPQIIQQNNQISQLTPHIPQSRKNSNYQNNKTEKENQTLKDEILNESNCKTEDILIQTQDPIIETLKVQAEQVPLRCISSTIANTVKENPINAKQDSHNKNNQNPLKNHNILQFKNSNHASISSSFNSRKSSNVSSLNNNNQNQINIQKEEQQCKTIDPLLKKYLQQGSQSQYQQQSNATKQPNQNKIQKSKLDIQLIQQQENIKPHSLNPAKKGQKNLAYEALKKIKNSKQQTVSIKKEEQKSFSQIRKKSQNIVDGSLAKCKLGTSTSIDQRFESKLNTEESCSAQYVQTEQGTDFRKFNKRNFISSSQVCQSLEDLPSQKLKDANTEEYLRSSLNQVRKSLNTCLNPNSNTPKISQSQNSRKTSIYEDQHLMDAKKQEIEALQNLINSYDQEEQKISTKLNEMNLNNIIIGDKKFLQQIRKSREERKHSNNNLSYIHPASSKNKTNNMNGQLEATFSNYQPLQNLQCQPNDFNQVHRLTGSFTSKSSKNSAKSSQQNSFSIDVKSHHNQNQSMNSQVQQLPWFMKKAPYQARQSSVHKTSQDGTHNIAPSNTARSYLNKSYNDIDNKSHLVSQYDISPSPIPHNPNEQINGIIKDLISDQVYLQAVALFTSCYYYTKQGTQNPRSQNEFCVNKETSDI